MEKKLKVAAASLNQTPLDWKGNLERIKHAIDEAKNISADLLCLPELCITGYGCEDLFLSTWVSEKAVSQLNLIAPECAGITVVVGLPIWHSNRNYNCACIIRDTKITGIYAKHFLANDGVHYEPRWFTPWEAGRLEEHRINGNTVPFGDYQFNIGEIKCGLEICEDAWRSDRPACRLSEMGVQLICNPSASHFAIGKSTRRKHLVIDSSRNFHCTYVYANLLGNESGRMIYDGELLIAQEGRLIQQNVNLSFGEVNLVYADINIDNPPASTAVFNLDNADRNDEFLRSATLALFDYLRKSRSNGYVLSLSGGADSSTIAVLVAEMIRRGIRELGLEKFLAMTGKQELYVSFRDLEPETLFRKLTGEYLTCAYQASQNSSDETRQSAEALARYIGADYHEWQIDAEVKSYTNTIERVINIKLTWEKDDITLQNIQARVRSPIIWMLANIKEAILLTTSNRSEGDVGYATMDGDTSGSLAPIAGIDKYFILKWLPWAEKHLGYKALEYVNKLTPTAELRPQKDSQTDETDLMPYKVILEIEKLAVYCHLSPVTVFQQLKDKNLAKPADLKRYIIKFYQLWARNQWKRERLAPAFHLDDYNIDPRTWCRFPILSGGYEEELEELKKLS